MSTKEKIKQVKGNIPLNEKLLNKYLSARDIFDNANHILKNKKITIKLVDIPEIENLDFSLIKIGHLKIIANKIFNNYHTKNSF